MIYVTGDLHGRAAERLSPENIPESGNMGKNDYVIALGDCGLIRDFNGENERERKLLDRLESLPFSVLFIDGNHENFDRLNQYPAEEWNGGTVHVIRPHVLHLTRGFVFSIDGRKIFTFGGGKSHHIGERVLDPFSDMNTILEMRKDSSRLLRINHINWWKEEMPDCVEMDRGIRSLRENNYDVDYILTHSPPSGILDRIGDAELAHDQLTDYLEEEVREKTRYSSWYSAHLHRYAAFDGRDYILFQELVRIN